MLVTISLHAYMWQCHTSSCSMLCRLLKQAMKSRFVTKEAHHSNQLGSVMFEWQNLRGISPKTLVHLQMDFCKNPFVFKKNLPEILKNSFVLSKSRTLFRMSGMSLGKVDLALALLKGMPQVMSNQLRFVYAHFKSRVQPLDTTSFECFSFFAPGKLIPRFPRVW